MMVMILRQLQRYQGPLFTSVSGELQAKKVRKSTYPPPADGVCFLFLCKPRCSANEPAAQARWGVLRATGSFTDCKDLKKCAGRSHSDVAGDHERGRVGGPGFIDRNRRKRRNTGIFRNEIDLFFSPCVAVIEGAESCHKPQNVWATPRIQHFTICLACLGVS